MVFHDFAVSHRSKKMLTICKTTYTFWTKNSRILDKKTTHSGQKTYTFCTRNCNHHKQKNERTHIENERIVRFEHMTDRNYLQIRRQDRYYPTVYCFWAYPWPARTYGGNGERSPLAGIRSKKDCALDLQLSDGRKACRHG